MSFLIFFLQYPNPGQDWVMVTTRNEMGAAPMVEKWEAVVMGRSPAVRGEGTTWGELDHPLPGLPSTQGLSSLLSVLKSQS